MKTLEVQLDESVATRLSELANKLGLTPEELVRRTVSERLVRLEDDFLRAAEYVVGKNEELYRRLS
jgi:predicted transcriptional regulator